MVIGYDTRIKSAHLARVAAGVYRSNGIKVCLWPEALPVPTLSCAVRALNASAGVMITASHNPRKYNGYKVYGANGCQITTEAAKEVLSCIEKVDCFEPVIDSNSTVDYIDDSVPTSFIEEVKKASVVIEDIARDVAIVYSPLNGMGLKPVNRVLQEIGFTNITVVKEQEQPDGAFSTCPYPNPERSERLWNWA